MGAPFCERNAIDKTLGAKGFRLGDSLRDRCGIRQCLCDDRVGVSAESANLYTADNTAACNKNPCVLYPKSAQLPSGRIVAAFENSQTTPVGQTMPVHKSDDDGTTWAKPADVEAPAELSSDPRYAKYSSNWTNPYLDVLPQDVGPLRAGTPLLASIVSGDYYYYQEQKAANSSWTPTGDGDREDVALALYASTDDDATWSFKNIIAAGGTTGTNGPRSQRGIQAVHGWSSIPVRNRRSSPQCTIGSSPKTATGTSRAPTPTYGVPAM